MEEKTYIKETLGQYRCVRFTSDCCLRCTENEAAQVSALIMAGATVIGYVIGEGLVDAAKKGDK